MLLLRFTAGKINKQSGSSNHRPEDFPVHQTLSQLSSPGQLPPRNHESERRFSKLCTHRAQMITTSANHRYQRCAALMKYFDCVSHYAVNLFLEPFTKRAQSVRIRTDTTLDQDCALKATVQVRIACMIVSIWTTCMNFNKYAKKSKNSKRKIQKKIEKRKKASKVLSETARSIFLRNVWDEVNT